MVPVEIIEKSKAGDRTSQKELYNRCSKYVYAIVKSYIKDDSHRFDAMQESFVHIFGSLEKFDATKGSFKSWISKITVNQSVSFLRKHYKLYMSITDEELTDNIFDNTLDTFDQLSKEEIDQLLGDMPLGYKTVFLLSVIDGYKHVEIAQILDITPETSRTQLMRSINWIKKNILTNFKKLKYESF